jgi:dipeptidyl aminopeptidase/acylaminoacyl peptidase
MSTTLPPAPPRHTELDAPDELEALIEEARRRARRRRALYGIAGMLAAGAALAGLWGSHRGGGGGARAASEPPSSPWALQKIPGRAPRPVANGPLALAAGDPNRVVLVGARGRFLRSLPICRPDPGCGDLQSVAWSPDGRFLTYGTVTGPGGPWHPRDGLHLFDLARNRDWRALPGGLTNWQDLAWSPDGKRLAYVAGASTFVLQAAHPDRVTELRANATSPSWSPDGTLIAFDRFNGHKPVGISVSRTGGTHARRLTQLGAEPAWSPDGTRIAYTVSCGIRLMTPTGLDVTPNSVWKCSHIGFPGYPTWSPDGRWLAIGGAKAVYVLHPDGSGLKKIWNRGTLRPSWRAVRGG